MAKLDNPQAGAAKWASKMGSARQAYIDGVNGVQEAPGLAAARASGKWLARTQAAQPKFEKNVSAVTITDWKNLATTKGADRLGPGATAALPKVEAFTASFYAYLKAGQAAIKAMPTNTFEESMAKAYAQADYNRKYQGYR